MSKTVRPIIEELFASAEPLGQPVSFSWRLIRKKGRPFMLLPSNLAGARAGMNLYSAQRRVAKFWRVLLPWLLQTPAANFFERIQFAADANSEMMRFIARQTGIPGNVLALPAIKLSEVGERSRLVVLLCDESGRPARVIKVGLNEAGQADTNREADFLEKLPTHTIGCIRMTGRIRHANFSAFATDYYPGESPQDDVGMEHLFHAWLNSGAAVALESLPMWRELESVAAQDDPDNWRALKTALAGKMLRPTLYHGDFAPWNVRAVSSQNLQAFDWERGQLQGIPGWDWFHFIIQTAILARRHSTERTAAEVEQLIHSERFKKYAAAAGISDIIQPLVLAYLLHHRLIIKPLEGGRATGELFDFLLSHWRLADTEIIHKPAAIPATPAAPCLWATVCGQLRSVASQWSNLFWEPSLAASTVPPMGIQLRTHWRMVALTVLLLANIATLQYFSSTHLVFLPFYVLTCAVATWQVDRRWGAASASVAAVLGPLVLGIRDSGFRETDVVVWNTVMRFVILQMCVTFVDRIHREKDFSHPPVRPGVPVKPGETWVGVLLGGVGMFVAVGIDIVTDPQMNLLPIYLFPCMVLTLVKNLRWGIGATVMGTAAGAFSEYFFKNHDHYTAGEVLWNFWMRLLVTLLVIFLLDRIRKGNILFLQRK